MNENDNQRGLNQKELAMLKLKQLVYKARAWQKAKSKLRNELPQQEYPQINLCEPENKLPPSDKNTSSNMKKVKTILYSLIGLIVILIITNPSNDSFKQFLYAKYGYDFSKNLDDGDCSYGREMNFFIFSMYVYNNEDGNKKSYIGIIGNFFKIQDY